ncbi:MAG TPA: DUF1800 domain-containing protein [Terriglobia bacterium]
MSRITFGPRPGDLERVQALGLDAFLNQQLHPERLDDSAIEARLAGLPTLSMSTGELMEKYPDPNQVQRKQSVAGAFTARKPGGDSGASNAEAMSTAPMSPASMGQFGDTPREVLAELGREELLRAVYSSRQLQEVMVQFWMNHFNIFAGKGPDKWMLTSFERDTIRPRALGRFEDLLVATAQSPAMLFYLDNWMSSAPGSDWDGPFAAGPRFFPARPGGWQRFGPGPVRQNQPLPGGQKRGLNENYGRELMELHTLSVNGGYTQKDVTEVARCLTGWTVLRPRQEAEFSFNPRMHDRGEKTVLGHRITGGGIEDGLQVLHLLATHPSTAQFISTKLCRRFVADDPPASLVQRTSREFLASKGDMRAVLKTILTSPEFYSEAAYRSKVKSPLETVASTLRALNAETDGGPQLLGLIARMGAPMFLYQAPAGYPDRAGAWISSSALLGRLNFAALVAQNRVPGTTVSLDGAAAEGAPAAEAVDRLSYLWMGTTLSGGSRTAILDSLDKSGAAPSGQGAVGDSFATLPSVAALVIGSPEFQRR